MFAGGDGERPEPAGVGRLDGGFEVRVAGGDGDDVRAALDGEAGEVDREFHVDVAAGDDHFEPAGLGRLDEFGGGVLVDVEAGRRRAPGGRGRLAHVVQIDVELPAEHVGTVDEERDAGLGVVPVGAPTEQVHTPPYHARGHIRPGIGADHVSVLLTPSSA